MPNQQRTPARGIRISDEVWTAVQKRAEEDGVASGDVVRAALAQYLGLGDKPVLLGRQDGRALGGNRRGRAQP